MPRIRIKMTGSGTPSDPFTLPLPTFLILGADYQNGVAIVDVPPSLIPPGAAQIGVTRQNIPPFGSVITGVQPQDAQKVADWLDNHYPDLAGIWRPLIQ